MNEKAYMSSYKKKFIFEARAYKKTETGRFVRNVDRLVDNYKKGESSNIFLDDKSATNLAREIFYEQPNALMIEVRDWLGNRWFFNPKAELVEVDYEVSVCCERNGMKNVVIIKVKASNTPAAVSQAIAIMEKEKENKNCIIERVHICIDLPRVWE